MTEATTEKTVKKVKKAVSAKSTKKTTKVSTKKPVVEKEEKRPKINEQQDMFCREFIIDLCAKNAAIRAGYSPFTAEKIGYRLHKQFQWRIDELMARRIMRTDIDSDWVIRELVDVVRCSKEGTPVLDIRGEKVTTSVRKAVDKTEVAAVYQFNAKGATGALELLGKHLGMFTEKVELTGNIGIADALKAARERVKNGKEKQQHSE